MKILMTSDTFLPQIGGAEIHVQNLVENLLGAGHEVALITTETGRSNFDVGKNVTRTPWGKSNIIKIFRLIWADSGGATVIHSHYCHKLALFAGIAGRLRNIPVFITLHGMGILDHPGTPFFYRQAHSFYRYFSLQLATHVISTSQDLANYAYKYIPQKKITIILNGYDSSKFYYGGEVSGALKNKYSDKKIILTVRRLAPKNGIQYLIESIPLIVAKVPNAYAVIIGDGRMRDHIEERIKALDVGKYIDLLGTVGNDDIPDYLRLADVVVFPSTAESSSIACAEAMAMGKSIVASRVGGLVELLGEHDERGTLVKIVDWEGSDYDAPVQLPQESYMRLAEAVIKNIQEEI